MFSGVWRFQYYFSSYVSSHFQQSMADLPPGKPQISEKGGVSSLGNSPGTDSPIKEPKPWMNLHLPAQLQWIPRNWTWSNLKPVIRCSIVAWVSAVLFIIPRVELLMGQVCFLVLMCTLSWSISQGKFSNSYWWELLICLCDPFHWSRCFSGLFISTQRSIRWCPGTRISNSVVRGVIMVVSGHITLHSITSFIWSRWASLGMFLANLARTNMDRSVTFIQALSGEYIQTAVRTWNLKSASC